MTFVISKQLSAVRYKTLLVIFKKKTYLLIATTLIAN